jgi:hypothetical protein
MQDFHPVTNSLSPIVVYDTTLRNGAVQASGMFHFILCIHIYSSHSIYRPKSKEELFNLRHSSARNVIERIFGVLKRRFRILLLAPAYNLDVQARIPAALSAIHNFIRAHDHDEGPMVEGEEFHDIGYDAYSGVAAGALGEDGTAGGRRGRIAQEMWEDYQRVCQERGVDKEGPDDDDDDELETIGDDIV